MFFRNTIFCNYLRRDGSSADTAEQSRVLKAGLEEKIRNEMSREGSSCVDLLNMYKVETYQRRGEKPKLLFEKTITASSFKVPPERQTSRFQAGRSME